VYGFTVAVEAAMREREALRPAGHSGIGTTLAANALAFAALEASLAQLMTRENYAHMDRLASQLAGRLQAAFAAHGLAWYVSRVGARVEFGRGAPPRNGAQSLAARDPTLDSALHLFLINHGFLLTPFHNMMLVSPATTPAQVERFAAAFDDALHAFAAHLRSEA
jgi:glutamate-1-semialdehyde 2,1-aminomutase